MKTNSKNPLISVAIITWNRQKHVLKSIESALKQSYRPIEIVVVDSASSDGTSEAIEQVFPEVRLVRLHRNLGCPEGRNIAMANCTGEIIFSIDDDAWFDSSTLKLCVECFKKKDGIGVVNCQVLVPKQNKNATQNNKEHYTYQFNGGACAIKKEVLNKVGYFPADFYRQGEENDLALKILDAGFSILHYPPAIVYHERVSINRNNKLFMFYGCRNELYTVIRRYPLFFVPAMVSWKAISWNWLGIKNFAFHFTLGACFATAIKFPKLLLQREAVSLKTIKRVIKLRRNRSVELSIQK